MTPEQRAHLREVGRAAAEAWQRDHPGDKKGTDAARQRAISPLRYKYDPRRKNRSVTKSTVYLPCSCGRVGGLWLGGDGLQPGQIIWRDCDKLTRFDWSTGHVNWVRRAAAKEFLMGRHLYLRPRAATPADWSSVTPSDPVPLDPRLVLEQLGVASDPESFALLILSSARALNTDATRLPAQRADQAALRWAKEQLANPPA